MMRKAGNDMFTLVAHSSHLLQPVDRSIAKSFKKHIDNEIQLTRMGSPDVPGVAVGFHNVLGCAKKAWDTVAGPGGVFGYSDIIRNGFKKSGTYPFNRDCIAPSFYAPALAYDESLISKRKPITKEEIKAALDANLVTFEKGELQTRIDKQIFKKRAAAVPGSMLLTSDQHVANILASKDVKEEAAAGVAARKIVRLEKREAKKAAKQAAVELRAGKKAAAPVTAKGRKGKASGTKKRRAVAAEGFMDAVERFRKGASARRKAKNTK